MDKFSSLTKDDVPPIPTTEARLPRCPEHPDDRSRPGYGYAGGGFGRYQICNTCDVVFGKLEERDGNDA